jgi:hypothetical protein
MLKEFEKAAEEFIVNMVEDKPFVLNFFTRIWEFFTKKII